MKDKRTQDEEAAIFEELVEHSCGLSEDGFPMASSHLTLVKMSEIGEPTVVKDLTIDEPLELFIKGGAHVVTINAPLKNVRKLQELDIFLQNYLSMEEAEKKDLALLLQVTPVEYKGAYSVCFLELCYYIIKPVEADGAIAVLVFDGLETFCTISEEADVKEAISQMEEAINKEVSELAGQVKEVDRQIEELNAESEYIKTLGIDLLGKDASDYDEN